MKKSVAITREGKDLLRLIPSNIVDGSGEFIISMLNNDYNLRLKENNTYYFNELETDIRDYQITYHKSNNHQSTKIHFKSIDKTDGKVEYSTFPLKNLSNPIIDSRIPFPLFEIGISPKDEFKTFKPNKKYAQLDLGKHNVAEVFIVDKEFDEEDFRNNWSMFDLLLTVLPLNYFTNGKLNANGYKIELFQAQNKSIFMNKKIIDVSENLSIVANFYTNPHIDGFKQQSYIQFFDNDMYLKYLSCVPIEYSSKEGNISEQRRAYEWQLERIKGSISDKEYNYYKELFKGWHNKIKEKDITLDGLTLQV